MDGALRDQAQLVSVWDAAARVPDIARAAAVIGRCGLVEDLDAALDLPLGEAAACAARLHAAAFGDLVDCLMTCAACTTVLDVAVPLTGLPAPGGETTRVVAADGRELCVRAPTTRDLLAAVDRADPTRALLVACVADASGVPADPDDLGDEALALVDSAAEELAGAAAIVVRATCPECGAAVDAPLDVGALLWDRLSRAANEALREVADLAAAFGWSEGEVLALSPLRRRAYLEIVRSRS